jgi:hypothetical protein
MKFGGLCGVAKLPVTLGVRRFDWRDAFLWFDGLWFDINARRVVRSFFSGLRIWHLTDWYAVFFSKELPDPMACASVTIFCEVRECAT